MLTNDNIYTEPQIKKHLTAEEHAMRRAEMARRRKNLSEKRNEEEKVTKTSFPMTLYFFFLSFLLFTIAANLKYFPPVTRHQPLKILHILLIFPVPFFSSLLSPTFPLATTANQT